MLNITKVYMFLFVKLEVINSAVWSSRYMVSLTQDLEWLTHLYWTTLSLIAWISLFLPNYWLTFFVYVLWKQKSFPFLQKQCKIILNSLDKFLCQLWDLCSSLFVLIKYTVNVWINFIKIYISTNVQVKRI